VRFEQIRSEGIPDREERKGLLLRLYSNCHDKARSKQEYIWLFDDILADTASLSLDLFERTCDRIRREPGRKWFPTVGEFTRHARAIQDIAGTPTKATLIAQQAQAALPAPEWTRNDFKRAEAALDAMPDGSVFKASLERVLKSKEVA